MFPSFLIHFLHVSLLSNPFPLCLIFVGFVLCGWVCNYLCWILDSQVSVLIVFGLFVLWFLCDETPLTKIKKIKKMEMRKRPVLFVYHVIHNNQQSLQWWRLLNLWLRTSWCATWINNSLAYAHFHEKY